MTNIPDAERDASAAYGLTVGQHVDAARASGRCIGYRKYTRTPGRVAWFVCRHPADDGSDRCGQCVVDDVVARRDEDADQRARAYNRAELAKATAGLRYVWTEPLMVIDAKRLIHDIEDAVRHSSGGQGQYWLALRLLAEVD